MYITVNLVEGGALIAIIMRVRLMPIFTENIHGLDGSFAGLYKSKTRTLYTIGQSFTRFDNSNNFFITSFESRRMASWNI